MPAGHAGVRIDPRWCVQTYRGSELPSRLSDYGPRQHSWEGLVDAMINDHPVPVTHDVSDTARPLREYQREQHDRIRTALNARTPGYLLNWPVGSGKTPISIAALSSSQPSLTILIITRQTLVGMWRSAINQFAVRDGHRWVVINAERMWRLFTHPTKSMASVPGHQRLEAAASFGVPHMIFDAVIVDECHMLGDPDSRRARMVRRLESPFQVDLSATPFSTPLETEYLSDLLAYGAGVDPPNSLTDYRDWLRRIGFRLNVDEAKRWRHDINSLDLRRITSLLYENGVGAAVDVDQLGLPRQERQLLPIELSPEERVVYEKGWQAFRRELGVEGASAEPAAARASALRNLQKASLIKTPYLAEIIADFVERGYQVAVPAFFLDTVHALAKQVAQALAKRGLPDQVVTMVGADISGVHAAQAGREYDRRELKRQAFQAGVAKVAIFNAHEGVNLQAGEQNIDGSRHDSGGGIHATTAPRVTVLADVLTGGKRILQAEGRTHRDGQSATAFYAYAADTTEQEWLAKVFTATANTRALSLSHGDAATLLDLARELDTDRSNLPAHGPASSDQAKALSRLA